jgi:dolichyl-phosphate-mannose-protein mannosyltransferase
MERYLALMVIAVAAVVMRVWNPGYSTAYMDESIYVVYGRMFLSHHFEAPLDTPLQWSFGWYLWPAMAAIADRIGGLIALRELAAGLGAITVAAVYGFASRVFSKMVGLGAAAVMAVLAPALLVSRIATRDSGSICFFAVGLWAFACGWKENRKRDWLLAGLFFFAAFLCKYLVAIYFPLLVILALFKGKKPIFLFGLPLFIACSAYGITHWNDLVHLLRYGAAYGSLRAPAAEAWKIYVWSRWDFWVIVLAALTLLIWKQWRGRALLLWLGAATILAFQWKSRADYDYWKHVNYALLFLVPAAVAGIITLVQRLQKDNYYGQLVWGVSGVLALAVGAWWSGGGLQSIERFVFWPNVDPVLAYFEGRLTPNDRVLVDDTVFRYYFYPPLHQPQIVDPMYFQYGDNLGAEAYKKAVQDGAFTYVVLNGGMGEEARQMDAVIRPALGSYQLQMSAIEPRLGHTIEIYARQNAAPVSDKIPNVSIISPASNSVVNSKGGPVLVEGLANGAQAGWTAQVEVFTDQWYAAEKAVPVQADGKFFQPIYLGGEGKQQCSHLLRARLFDQNGNPRAVTLNYGIARANQDGSLPNCR